MIERVDSVAACTTPTGKELALEIRHGTGHTLVTLDARPELRGQA